MAEEKSPRDVTRLLRDWSDGDAEAQEELWPLVYDELRRLAHFILRSKSPGRSLQTTALVHEAYLRLVGTEDLDWNDRGHFFAIAARAMRFILVDHARRSHAAKYGGGARPVSIEDALGLAVEIDVDLLALDHALKELEGFAPRQSRVVEMAYFGGLTYDEMAHALGISPATVKRELRHAKLWLLKTLKDEAGA